MKRVLLVIAAVITLSTSSLAQLNVFNHVGADVSVSTNGIGVELSTPVTPFMQLRAGMSFMPNITFNANVDGNASISTQYGTQSQHFDLNIEGALKRTQGNVILNVYPFGPLSGFFVAGGAYFGGEKVVELNGHSDEVEKFQNDGILQEGYIEIGDYKLDFERGGNIRGGLLTKKFRPYAGLGFGRPCPGSRLGFMVELGVQFMGKMNVCQGADLTPVDISNLDNDDKWQKVINKLTVYPVLKFTLCGRIF